MVTSGRRICGAGELPLCTAPSKGRRRKGSDSCRLDQAQTPAMARVTPWHSDVEMRVGTFRDFGSGSGELKGHSGGDSDERGFSSFLASSAALPRLPTSPNPFTRQDGAVPDVSCSESSQPTINKVSCLSGSAQLLRFRLPRADIKNVLLHYVRLTGNLERSVHQSSFGLLGCMQKRFAQRRERASGH